VDQFHNFVEDIDHMELADYIGCDFGLMNSESHKVAVADIGFAADVDFDVRLLYQLVDFGDQPKWKFQFECLQSIQHFEQDQIVKYSLLAMVFVFGPPCLIKGGFVSQRRKKKHSQRASQPLKIPNKTI
jgi:hypothetical protein